MEFEPDTSTNFECGLGGWSNIVVEVLQVVAVVADEELVSFVSNALLPVLGVELGSMLFRMSLLARLALSVAVSAILRNDFSPGAFVPVLLVLD